MANQEGTNVLYLSYDGMTDPLGQSQVIPYLEGLTKAGYNFTLLSFEKPERFEKFGALISGILKNAGIEWVPLMYTKSPPVVSTIYDYQRMKRTAYKLHQQKHFSIIHCRSYIAAMCGLAMQRKFGTKFLFDMRGFWADERVDGGIWNLGNPLYKTIYNFFKKRELEFFTHADYTISLTEAGKNVIQSWQHIPNQPIPIQVIPCCADLETFTRNNINNELLTSLKTKFNIADNQFVLSYLGSIGTWYMPDEMLDFFKCLLAQKPEAKFLFITNEPAQMLIDKAIAKGIDPAKLIVQPAARADVPTYLALGNWSNFFIKPVFSKTASSPTKQGEIMGMGIPHVCNTGVGDIDAIMHNTHSGYTVTRFNTNEYNHVVQQMLTSQPDYKDITDGAQTYYSLQNGIAKYLSVYKKILAAAPRSI